MEISDLTIENKIYSSKNLEEAMLKTSFTLLLIIILIVSTGYTKAQDKMTKNDIKNYLTKEWGDCFDVYNWAVRIDSLQFYDLTNDGNEDAIVTAWSCYSGTGGPDYHGVLSKDSTGNITELVINYGPNDIYDNLVGNRNFYLTHKNNFLVANFYDNSGRDYPLIVFFQWNGKEFITAKVIKAKTFKASFNCNNAKSDAEKTICGNAKLAAIDIKMDSLYTIIMSKFEGNKRENLKNDQKKWIEERDRKCNYKFVENCVLEMYEKRIIYLTELIEE